MNRKSPTLSGPLRNVHFAAKVQNGTPSQKPSDKLNNKSKELSASKESASRSRGPSASLGRDSAKIQPQNTPISKTKKNVPQSNTISTPRKKSPRIETLDRLLEKYLEIDEKTSLSPQPKKEENSKGSIQVKKNESSFERSKEMKNSFVKRGSTEQPRRQLNKSHEMRTIFIYSLRLTELSRKYTVFEDWRILESVKYSKDTEGVRGILSPKRWETIKDPRTDMRLLNGNRSSESMRERYKRHLINMNSEDIKTFDKFVKSHSEEDMKQYALHFTKKEEVKKVIWTPPDSSLSLNPQQSERKNKSPSANKSFSKILPSNLLSKSVEIKTSTSFSKSIPPLEKIAATPPFPSRILARVQAQSQAQKTLEAKKRSFSPHQKEEKKSEFENTPKKVKLSSPQPRPTIPKESLCPKNIRETSITASKNTTYFKSNKFFDANKSFTKIIPSELLNKSEETKISTSLFKPILQSKPPEKTATAIAQKTFYAKKRPFSPPKKANESDHILKKVKLSLPQPRPITSKDAKSVRETSTAPSKNTSYLRSSDPSFDQTNSRERRIYNSPTAPKSMESAISLDQKLKNLADLKIDYMILINCKAGTREFIETNKIIGADRATEKELCKMAKTYKTTLGEVVNLVNKHNNPEKFEIKKDLFRFRY